MSATLHDILLFQSREEWRDWLFHHHKNMNEQWIFLFKRAHAHKGLTYEEAMEEAVCFGWVDSVMKGHDEEKFSQRFSPRRKGRPWSLTNKDRAEAMIKKGFMEKAGFEMVEDAKQSGWWEEAYSSKTKPILPEEMAKVLKSNANLWQAFNKLSNSDQLRYIFWVKTAKKQETRKKRIQEIMDKLG